MDRRYYVYNPAESKPTYIHQTYEDAMQEAIRISNKIDEGTVYVLEIVGEIHKKLLVEEKRINRDGQENIQVYDKIPF
jgi:hypothetical protein